MKNFFKVIFLTLLLFSVYQTSSIAVEEKKIENEDELQKKLDTLTWHNWDNPKAHTAILEKANAELDILETEYYLKGNDVNQHSWWVHGKPSYRDMVIFDGTNLYSIYVEFVDEGYVTVEDWKSTNNDDWLKELQEIAKENAEIFKEQNLDYVQNINWIFEPKFDDKNKNVNYSYKVEWSDGDITMEATNILLGRKGYLEMNFVTTVTPDTNFVEEAKFSKEFASYVNFKEGSKHSDYKSGDKIAAVGIGGLVAGTLGVKALAKVGVFAKLLPLLLKFGWILLIPLVFVGKLFGKKNQPRRSSKRKK